MNKGIVNLLMAMEMLWKTTQIHKAMIRMKKRQK
jgi:hypothetical protein